LGPDNVLCEDDRVVALIDSGWFVGGPPLFDVAHVLNSRLGGAGAPALLEGYADRALSSNAELLVLPRSPRGQAGLLRRNRAAGQVRGRREILLALAAACGLDPIQ
jgi:Ser/Thr protein kinase RdoA (MazF antagonist)